MERSRFLAILQRDSRLIDFLQEDIAAYSDDQIGAAVREIHDQSRDADRALRHARPGDRWRRRHLRQGPRRRTRTW